jgi:hypothetical protein
MHNLIAVIYGCFQSWFEMQCTVCRVRFSQKMVPVIWMPEPPYRMTGQSKKMAAGRLSFESRKTVFAYNWKFKNGWTREFATESPTRLTTACIRDKAETDGTVDLGGLAQQRILPLLLCFTRSRASDIHFTCHSSVLWELIILISIRWSTITPPPKRQKIPRWNPTRSMDRTNR